MVIAWESIQGGSHSHFCLLNPLRMSELDELTFDSPKPLDYAWRSPSTASIKDRLPSAVSPRPVAWGFRYKLQLQAEMLQQDQNGAYTNTALGCTLAKKISIWVCLKIRSPSRRVCLGVWFGGMIRRYDSGYDSGYDSEYDSDRSNMPALFKNCTP